MKVKALKLKDERFANWFEEVEHRWDYDDFIENENWRKGWISFDCCLYLPETERIYCGITSFDSDIFWAYDRISGEFCDCGFKGISNPYDAKFHRSLVKWERDGCLYAAVALLHDVDRYTEAPGGAIVKYNPKTGDITKIAVPLPRHYIQSITIDEESGIIYGFTFTPEKLFSYNILTGEARELGVIGSGIEMAQGENLEIDGRKRVWSGWGITRAWSPAGPGPDSMRLCMYDPSEERITYYKTGLPLPDGRFGFVKAEGLFNFGDELFASGGNGSIYHIDIDTGKAKYLFTPITGRRSRLTSLRLAPDGFAYGVTGRDGRCELLRFNPADRSYKLLGKVSDGIESCYQVHDVAVASDMTIYACENDNPYRSGYLWEIKL